METDIKFKYENRQTDVLIQMLPEIIAVFDSKQSDYGSGNISKFGEVGCLVRASDKIERLTHLIGPGAYTGTATPQNESVEDSWSDLALYSLIALMVRRGQWNTQTEVHESATDTVIRPPYIVPPNTTVYVSDDEVYNPGDVVPERQAKMEFPEVVCSADDPCPIHLGQAAFCEPTRAEKNRASAYSPLTRIPNPRAG